MAAAKGMRTLVENFIIADLMLFMENFFANIFYYTSRTDYNIE